LAGNLIAGMATLAIAAPLVLASPAPETARPEDETQVFETGTAAVILDVVIRDKKGRPVLDIRPEEVGVYEEGEKQTIESFERAEAASPVEGIPEEVERPDASRQMNVVTFVFDQLGVDGRRLARRAADAFLEKGLGPNTWVSVFRLDQGLVLMQPFTNREEPLRKAVADATSGTFMGVTNEQAALQQALADLETATDAVEQGGTGGASGTEFAARAQARALVNMLRMSQNLQRQQVGTSSLYPLMALVRGHRTLAGRKTLVYLSEGLQVPPQLDAVYRSVISEANLSNVSVYAIDARGLDTARAMEDARDALEAAREVSFDTQRSGGAGRISKEQIKLSETAESALRADVQATMQELAESTGGFLIANTNNFDPGAERIADDIASYYRLTYVPPPSPFDGRFRSIEVKVARKDVSVQARSGYFALPPGESSALFPYEVPLLGALTVDPPPRDFEMRTGALRFGRRPGGLDHKLLVEVPITNLEMPTDEEAATYRLHFSLVAMVKSEGGAVVERYSEDYPFEGPIERVERLKQGNIVFKRRLALPPGRYTLEVAGQDRETGQMSVSRSPIRVPPDEAIRMSSLTFIRRLEDLPPGTESDDPLDLYDQKRIVPNLGAPVSLAVNPKLWLFFMAYPDDPSKPATMTLEFSREGRTVSRAETPLPDPDPDGVIRNIVPFATERFSPGTYGVRVVLDEAETHCEEVATLTLAP
jgi:VWFA-related protein